MKNLTLLIIALSTLLLASCASDKNKDPYEGLKAQKIYSIGHSYLKDDDYRDAIKAYESLNAQYPYSKPSQNGNLELIYAYYLSGDPALSLAASARYLKLYQDSPDAAYAYYMAGVIEFNNGRGFIQRYFPYDMSAHASANYLSAIGSFDNVIQHFPNSHWAGDSKRRRAYLIDTLAKHQVNIAQHYYDLGAYVAAINRAENALMHYPRTESAKSATRIMIDSYQKLGLTELAQQATAFYKLNF